ncbi:MAG: hypothetical protein J1D85_02995 [Bacteroidales bacterium]|nr:hypothetical protein [Bacteroidales bacterium]
MDKIKVFHTFVTVYRAFRISVFCIFLLLGRGFASSAQEAGVFNSPKGIGACLSTWSGGGNFCTLTAYADIYGVATSRCQYPGFRMNAMRQFTLRTLEANGMSMSFYAGTGLSAGYVRDHDKGRWVDLSSLVSDNPGVMLALSGDVGCHFDFGRSIGVDLSFTADAGVHIRRNEAEQAYRATSVSVFNNGLWQVFYPQFIIYFKLK